MEKRTKLLARIKEKAMMDGSFLKALKNNPKEALKNAFNLNISKNMNVKVLQETNTQLYLVLPTSPEEEASVNAAWL